MGLFVSGILRTIKSKKPACCCESDLAVVFCLIACFWLPTNRRKQLEPLLCDVNF